MTLTPIEQVRSFNRAMTERIGVLNDHFLGQSHPYGEARLLWEIGEGGATVRSLRRRLGLDSAYVSRLLRSLEAQGLVVVAASESDGRVREVQLTEAGRGERAELDQRSDEFARSLLEPLSETQREKLVEAMAQVERLLTASMVEIAPADPTSAEARWCIEQYFAELNERFENGFSMEVSKSVQVHEFAPPGGLLLVARLREEPVGCGGLLFHGDAPADIKRVWIARSARGLGLGRRMLQELERAALARGVNTVRLDTNRVLTEAINMYRANGYYEIPRYNDEPYAHHWFEKRLG